jgi:hypothetical protein
MLGGSNDLNILNQIKNRGVFERPRFFKLNNDVAPSAARHKSTKKPPISVDRIGGDLIAGGHGSGLNLRVHGYYLLKSAVNCQAAFCFNVKKLLDSDDNQP